MRNLASLQPRDALNVKIDSQTKNAAEASSHFQEGTFDE